MTEWFDEKHADMDSQRGAETATWQSKASDDAQHPDGGTTADVEQSPCCASLPGLPA